jgi:N-acyl amino acid synthase of PEP-CTERM/exosortase system
MFLSLDADTPDLQKKSYGLRYQVYCLEKGYENPHNYPDGLEIDSFDSHSMHTLLEHSPSGREVGTVRLVLPIAERPEWSFPLQLVCAQNGINTSRWFPAHETAEMSRFCVSKQRRTGWSIGCEEKASGAGQAALDMTVGLIEGVVRRSAEAGITYLCAAMEPSLLRLLSRLSIYFRPFGPLLNYHGKRQPCWVNLLVGLDRVYREQKDVWQRLTADGAHWDALVSCRNARQQRFITAS